MVTKDFQSNLRALTSKLTHQKKENPKKEKLNVIQRIFGYSLT